MKLLITSTATEPTIHDSILGTIGDTPLVRLSRIGAGLRPTLVAKIEAFNPGGSIKDRIALALIEEAERDGRLRPGGTIVEPTSGNTGAGLAIVALLRGYRVIAVMPDKMSEEKIDLLRAYGAEVVVAPTDVPPDSSQSYYRVADRLTAEIPGAFQPNQYFNQANPRAHYESTGPEIWRQTAGRITHLVVGVGTGGTVTGAVRYLRKHSPDLVVIGADPEGSIYAGGAENVRPYLVEGVGEDFWPETFDPSVVDRWVTVSDREAFLTTRRLARLEGILAGGSGGLALHAALAVAGELADPDALVLVILPDGGRSYLSKIYSDGWMRQYGFLERGRELLVADVLAHKRAAGEVPTLVSVQSDHRVREAITLLHEHRVSQLPVVSAERGGEVVGAVGERGLLKHAAHDAALLDAEIGAVITRSEDWYERLRYVQNAAGAVPGPLDCFLVHRGLRTLHLRMQAHARSAAAVVERLRASTDVCDVRWPGFSGMVGFRHPRAAELVTRTRLFALAESLGGVESLIEVPQAMTHQSVEGSSAAVPADLVRLSCGVEDPQDLAHDIELALATVRR